MTALARARNLRAVTDTPRRGVAYLRQSTKKEETISDEIQLAAIKNHAARSGITIVKVIWEQQTGRIWHKRKGVLEAMRLIEEGEAEVILLWKWSRLSRRKLHWAVAEDKVERLGGSIESATEAVDITTASGRFSRNMLVDVAEFESDRIGEGWKEAHALRRSRGLPATGGPRFGYRHVREPDQPERYEVVDGEADVVRWLVREYLDGTGFNVLAAALNRRGVVTPRGRRWTNRGVYRMLDSGFVAGLLSRVDFDERPVEVGMADRAWDKGAHEAIIDGPTWSAYRRARVARGSLAPRVTTPVHALSGLLVCGDCEGPMVRRKDTYKGRPVVRFRCSRRRQSGDVASVNVTYEQVITAVLAFLERSAADVEQSVKQAAEVRILTLRASTDAEIASREVVELDRQLARLARIMLAADESLEASYKITQAELQRDRKAASERLALAEAASQVVPPAATEAADLLREWNTLAVDRRRTMLKRLVREVWVMPAAEGVTVEVDPVWQPARARKARSD